MLKKREKIGIEIIDKEKRVISLETKYEVLFICYLLIKSKEKSKKGRTKKIWQKRN